MLKGLELEISVKQASPERVEASFNRDYDRILSFSERGVLDIFLPSYTDLFEQINRLGPLDPFVRNLAYELFLDSFRRSYYFVGENFSNWYFTSFEGLSEVSPQTLTPLIVGALDAASRSRTINRFEGMLDSSARGVESGLSPEIFADRTALTETNGIAGLSIETTAAAMFGGGGSNLFKRWISVGDERVRRTHQIASSKKPIPKDQLYQVGDVLMRFPADPEAFGGNVAGEVINCRCRSMILPISATGTQQLRF